MEGNVKVHVESRTRLPDMEDVLHFRGSGTLERTPSGWQLWYQARSDEDGSLMTSELWLEDCGCVTLRSGNSYRMRLDPAAPTVLHLPTEEGVLALDIAAMSCCGSWSRRNKDTLRWIIPCTWDRRRCRR